VPKFGYNDVVRVKATVRAWFEILGVGCHKGPRSGERAYVFSIGEGRKLAPLDPFPSSGVYGIEFDDGGAVEVHEEDLELVEKESPYH
jgi:hypothetical protein